VKGRVKLAAAAGLFALAAVLLLASQWDRFVGGVDGVRTRDEHLTYTYRCRACGKTFARTYVERREFVRRREFRLPSKEGPHLFRCLYCDETAAEERIGKKTD
jgi:hypothetical protein